ncbi:hypothetical protein COU18_00675 [Candidatus Kaiserbacteria bacterium CG10_big_fil_rev_8_21_14_0_10_51_14]|uniref:Uncharacterized protein n=1 Tax=Candidatus Kaiserbacteria bacterium CG10_big_fil_rev_8_21_14_0_10_51_14 TaxID=1974610 RepID=A0A2H0UE16_9BACT|nr:MAG: hypothetical protein COU18_00675 [Candidatus Kaiserbacteria bacterium CG10_big_fil_rev_8_21_14_0_10_51_14]
MNKIIIGAVVIILVAAGGVFVWKTLPSAQPSEAIVPTPEVPTTSTYATTTYSVSYSRDFTLDSAHTYEGVSPTKPIYGVRFTIPIAMATGTNLSSDTYLSVEQLPRAQNCTGDIYLLANVKANTLTENGVDYSLASSTEGAAGNRYEEMVYALADSKPCTAVRYFIHSTSIGNYATGTVREFDRVALLAAFDTIRASIVLGSAPTATSTSTTTNP